MTGVASVLLLWQWVVALELYPTFIIPAPLAVLRRFLDVLGDGRLLHHTSVTLSEMLLGLAIGAAVGLLLGYALAKNELLEDALSPIILAFQSTPVVAYAPLLVIWFGTDSRSKIIICALIVFFPLLMNTIVGVRSVPTVQRDVMRLYAASRWQTFVKLEIPASLPVLFGGLKVSATLAVIGAVVGEFIGANAGLGFMISLARSQFDTPLVYVGVLMLALIARLTYGVIALIESRVIHAERRTASSRVE